MAEVAAFGISIKKGSGSPVTIARLLEASWGGLSLEFKDTTNHGNAAPVRTQRPVMAKADALKLKVQLGSDQVNTIYPWVDPTAAADTFTLTIPTTTPTVVTCSGWMAKFEIPTMPPDGIVELDLEIQLTGKPAITP